MQASNGSQIVTHAYIQLTAVHGSALALAVPQKGAQAVTVAPRFFETLKISHRALQSVTEAHILAHESRASTAVLGSAPAVKADFRSAQALTVADILVLVNRLSSSGLSR